MKNNFFGAISYLLIFLSVIIVEPAFSEGPGADDPEPSMRELPYSLPDIGQNDFPNEFLQVQSGELELKYRDIHIPGPNGMDVDLFRSYSAHGISADSFRNMGNLWFLDIPRILVKSNEDKGTYSPNRTECYSADVIEVAVPEEKLASTVGFSSDADLPVGAPGNSMVFPNNAVLECGTTPVMRYPDGRVIEFGIKYNYYGSGITLSDPTLPRTQYYASKIYDRFGNTIVYEYSYQNVTLSSGKQYTGIPLLSRIVSPEGATVELTYQDINSFPKVKAINYNNKSIVYSYDANHRLISVTDEEGRVTKYTWGVSTQPFFNSTVDEHYIKSIEIPEGAKITYSYTTLTSGDPAVCGLTLPCGPCRTYGDIYTRCHKLTVKSKTITGPDIEARTISYNRWHYTDYVRVEVTEPAVSNGTRTSNFYFLRVLDVEESANSGEHALAGQLYLKDVRLDSKILYKKKIDWNYRKKGTYGCGRFYSGLNSYLKCGEAYISKETETLYYADGNDTFTKEYLSYNTYNQPTKVKEYNSFYEKYRYTSRSYYNDKNYWLISNPLETKISEDGVSWSPVRKITYYSSSSEYKSSPNYIYEFGKWKSRFASYYPTGDIKKIEYNGTSKYELFENYYRGKARKITVPKRYESGTDYMAKTFDNEGRITWLRNFRGMSTYYHYDGIGRVTRISHTGGIWNDVHFQYDDALRIVQKSQGEYKSYFYLDGLGRVTKNRIDDSSHSTYQITTTRYEYNGDGYLTFESYPVSGTVGGSDGHFISYDGLNRKTEELLSGIGRGRNWYYLANNRIQYKDGRGYDTTTQFLSYSDQEYRLPLEIASPEYITTTSVYNVFQNPISITQEGVIETYVYDSYQRKCRVVRPDTGVTGYGYNAQDEIAWEAKGSTASATSCSTVPSAEKITYTYDNRMDLHSKTAPEGILLKQTLDAVGNITKMEVTGSEWNFKYNYLNLMTEEALSIDGMSLVMSYLYDPNGHILDVVYPSGKVSSFSPDGLGRPTRVGDYISNVQYHPVGAVKSFVYAKSGIERAISVNELGMPESMCDTLGASMKTCFEYEYDVEQNLINVYDKYSPGYNITDITYDGLNRLTGTGGSNWGSSSFSYSNQNSLTLIKHGSQSTSLYYNNLNRLYKTSAANGSRNFSYDRLGNITSNGGKTFVYNIANQMVSGNGVSFLYDGFGNRVRKTKDGKHEYFFYSRDGGLKYTLGSDGVGTDFIHLNGILVAKDTESTLPQPLSDFFLTWDGSTSSINTYSSETSGIAASLNLDDSTKMLVRWTNQNNSAVLIQYKIDYVGSETTPADIGWTTLETLPEGSSNAYLPLSSSASFPSFPNIASYATSDRYCCVMGVYRNAIIYYRFRSEKNGEHVEWQYIAPYWLYFRT